MSSRPRRVTLNPAFGAAIGRVFDRATVGRAIFSLVSMRPAPDGELVSVLETHDPRYVSRLADAIRKATEGEWARSFGSRGMYSPEQSRRFVSTVLAVGSEAAFPLMTVWSGHVREAAVRAVREISGPFCLSLLIHRLNDWVPQVRRAAEQKVASLIGQVDVKVILDCVELLWEFERFQRTNSEGRELVLGALRRADVQHALREEVLQRQDDRGYRLLRYLLRTPVLDDALQGIATAHRHPNMRAIAMRALLQNRYGWRDGTGGRQRSLTQPDNQERLARVALRDRASKVQLAGVEYLATRGTEWSDARNVLLSSLTSPSRPVAEMARWGLKQLGVDWVEELRQRLFSASTPSPRTAAALGHFGHEVDGQRIWDIATRYEDARAFPFLAAAAKLKSGDASDRLNRIAIAADDFILARRASRALREADILPQRDALIRMADRGDEFFMRGLAVHLAKLSALAQLSILCRLERAKAQFDPDQHFGIIRRKVNRGAFAPTPGDLEELRGLFAESPRVRELAKQHLAFTP